MNNIEKMLADEINSMPATDFEKIKETYKKIQNCNLQDTKTDKYTTQRKTVPLYVKASCIAAAFAIVFVIWSYFNLMPYSYVNIDMSPSIEISLNRLDKVISVRTDSDDTQNITGNFKPVGNLDETIDGLMQLLDENNYIDENNSIVVTVQCDKSDKRQQIMLLVNQQIESYINNNNKKINVISENIAVDDKLKNDAKKKGISAVKLTIESNNNHSSSDSINSANIIDNSNKNTTKPSSNKNNFKANNNTSVSVKESNTEITTVYIIFTENNMSIKPINESISHNNTHKNYTSDTDSNLQEKKPLATTPQTNNNDKAKDNTVNIDTLESLKENNINKEKKSETTTDSENSINMAAKDNVDTESTTKTLVEETTITNEVTETTTVIHSSGGSSSKSTISSEKAVSVACNYIGISMEDIELNNTKLSSGSYKIEFIYDNYKYEFSIDAYTGTIIKFETNINNANDNNDNNSAPVTPISLERAILNALNDANIAEENANITKSERSENIYNIAFLYNHCEYKYEIDAYSGEILDRKIQEQAVAISDKESLEIALKDINANENEIQIEKLEQKKDKFKIEFIYSSNRYSFEIDAYSGDIIEKEVQEHVVIISEETALSIVLNDIGAAETEIQIEKLEQKGDKLKLEFIYINCQYSYEIDAYSGEILEKEVSEQAPSISEETALLTALEDIGITENEIELKEIENKDGEFKIAFIYNSIEYKYSIDAFTNEILKRKADDNK